MQNKFAVITMIMVIMIGMIGLGAATQEEADVTVSIGDGNGTVTIPIVVENATNLGSCNIRLDFNGSVANVTSVTKVVGGMANVVSNIHSGDGWVRIVAWQGSAGGLDDNVTVANVTFTPADGCPMGNSDLILTVTTLKDATPQGQVIPRDIDNGVYTSMLNGDVNSDGEVDSADVDYLANNIVGTAGYPILCPIVADVDGSGGVDIADVRYLAMYLADDDRYDPLK